MCALLLLLFLCSFFHLALIVRPLQFHLAQDGYYLSRSVANQMLLMTTCSYSLAGSFLYFLALIEATLHQFPSEFECSLVNLLLSSLEISFFDLFYFFH